MRKKFLTLIAGLFILAGTGLVLTTGLTAKDYDPCCNAVALTDAEKAVLTGTVSDCEGTKTATAAKSDSKETAGAAKAGCGDKTATAAKAGCEAPASANVSKTATASVGGAAVAEKECCDGTAIGSADCCGQCTGEKSASTKSASAENAAAEVKAGCSDVSTAAVKSDCGTPASAGVSRSATAGEGVAGPAEKIEEKAEAKAGCGDTVSAEVKAGCEDSSTAAVKAGCGDSSTAAVKSDCEAPASAGASKSATAGEGVAGPAENVKVKTEAKAGCESAEKK